MRPFYKSGDVVEVMYKTPEIGDVALYELNGKKLAHRVVFNKGDYYIIGSDSATVPYHKVKKDCVIGVIEKRGNILTHIITNILYRLRFIKKLL